MILIEIIVHLLVVIVCVLAMFAILAGMGWLTAWAFHWTWDHAMIVVLAGAVIYHSIFDSHPKVNG